LISQLAETGLANNIKEQKQNHIVVFATAHCHEKILLDLTTMGIGNCFLQPLICSLEMYATILTGACKDA
jgi:hypothetical protein